MPRFVYNEKNEKRRVFFFFGEKREKRAILPPQKRRREDGGSMVRGTQKRIVYVKNTGGAVFEEAFFVVKDGKESGLSDGDMLGEATRIIEEHAVRSGRREEERRKNFPAWLFFLFGMLLSLVVSACAYFFAVVR